jgi:hypothetical protein
VVPDDLSVVGFDDVAEAAVIDPPLTTVHQPIREQGAEAAPLLMDAPADRRAAPSSNPGDWKPASPSEAQAHRAPGVAPAGVDDSDAGPMVVPAKTERLSRRI